jgi:hypothetical protein
MSELSEPCVPSCQVEIGGFTWTIYATTNAETIDRIVKVSKALSARGYSAPRRPAFGQGKPAAKPLAKPLYNSAGEPCCSVHNRREGQPTPLRKVTTQDGRSFWGCPAKSDGTPGETINVRGYCDLKFDVKE